jgi:transcriptional regulator CtsR
MIFDIEHNLKTMMPLASLYEPIGLTDFRSVSLYDSRVGFIESKGLNVSRVSFSAPFQGYISFLDIKNAKPSLEDRLNKIESTISSAIQQQKSFTTISQWKEMNNFEEKELQVLRSAINVLSNQLSSLEEEVKNL